MLHNEYLVVKSASIKRRTRLLAFGASGALLLSAFLRGSRMLEHFAGLKCRAYSQTSISRECHQRYGNHAHVSKDFVRELQRRGRRHHCSDHHVIASERVSFLFYDFIILCITKSEPASEFRMQEQTVTELTVTKTRTMKNDEDSNDDERYTKFMNAFCAGCGSEVRNE